MFEEIVNEPYEDNKEEEVEESRVRIFEDIEENEEGKEKKNPIIRIFSCLL